jgi:hypothetical protein
MKYDSTRRLPTPVIDVIVRASTESDAAVVFPARLDTGADVTLIPQSAIDVLSPPVVEYIVVAGYDDKLTERPRFLVDLEISGHVFLAVGVIAAPRSEILLGLDILNRFVITLDGPAQELKMLFP